MFLVIYNQDLVNLLLEIPFIGLSCPKNITGRREFIFSISLSKILKFIIKNDTKINVNILK